jgi:hypothetical protein
MQVKGIPASQEATVSSQMAGRNTMAVTVTPDPVELSGEQAVAALFTWSALPSETDAPPAAWVRQDLAGIMTANGLEAIESAAGWLACTEIALSHLTTRLAWCRRAVATLTGAGVLAVAR